MINLRTWKRYFAARRNARFYGITFIRAKGFVIPRSLTVCGESAEIMVLSEGGVKSDFFVNFIHDEYSLIKFRGKFLKIVDIGANHGFFSIAARANNPQAEIHAYEPNPRLSDVLRHNCEKIEATCFMEAVGADKGQALLIDSGDSNQARTSRQDKSGVAVPIVDLETVLKRIGGRIDLLKMDCEGAEWEILESPALTDVRTVAMEYHLWASDSETPRSVEKRLIDSGFNIIEHTSGSKIGYIFAKR